MAKKICILGPDGFWWVPLATEELQRKSFEIVQGVDQADLILLVCTNQAGPRNLVDTHFSEPKVRHRTMVLLAGDSQFFGREVNESGFVWSSQLPDVSVLANHILTWLKMVNG